MFPTTCNERENTITDFLLHFSTTTRLMALWLLKLKYFSSKYDIVACVKWKWSFKVICE